MLIQFDPTYSFLGKGIHLGYILIILGKIEEIIEMFNEAK